MVVVVVPIPPKTLKCKCIKQCQPGFALPQPANERPRKFSTQAHKHTQQTLPGKERRRDVSCSNGPYLWSCSSGLLLLLLTDGL